MSQVIFSTKWCIWESPLTKFSQYNLRTNVVPLFCLYNEISRIAFFIILCGCIFAIWHWNYNYLVFVSVFCEGLGRWHLEFVVSALKVFFNKLFCFTPLIKLILILLLSWHVWKGHWSLCMISLKILFWIYHGEC